MLMYEQTHKKVITFLLPGKGDVPTGGYKVVYEYANRLTSDGYKVNIVYPILPKIEKLSFKRFLKTCRTYIRYIRHGYSCKTWFRLDSRVKEKLVLTLDQYRIPTSDYYVATAIPTAYCLKEYDADIENKLYLIQDFESFWGGILKKMYMRVIDWGSKI